MSEAKTEKITTETLMRMEAPGERVFRVDGLRAVETARTLASRAARLQGDVAFSVSADYDRNIITVKKYRKPTK